MGKSPVALVIIPSAGAGRRMGSQKKNYLELAGRPVLAWTIEVFEKSPLVGAVIVSAAPKDVDLCSSAVIEAFGFKKVLKVVPGGAERQHSVAIALEAAKEAGLIHDIIAVHDGARPLVTQGIVDGVINAALEHGAAIAAVRVKDTIKEVGGGMVERTLSREGLWAAQTPQAFRSGLLIDAHERAQRDGFLATDESSLVERMGAAVRVVEGSYENIKITTPEDLAVAELVLKARTQAGREGAHKGVNQ